MDKYPVGVWRIGTSVLVSAGTAIIVTLLVLAIKEEGSIATTAAAQHEVSTEQEPLQSQEKQSHEQAEAERQRLASEAAEAAMQRQIGGGDMPAGFTTFINKASMQRQIGGEDMPAAFITFSNNVRRNVEQKWAIPDSADDSMSVTVKVRLGPAGEVLSTSIVTTSGNGAFDLSGIQAVENAAPFGELLDLPADQRRDLRQFNLRFTPGDLRR